MTAVLDTRPLVVDLTDTHAEHPPAPAPAGPSLRPSTPRALLTAMRPRQWVKNVLVVAAPAAAGALLSGSTIVRVTVAVAMMCLAASATYLLNDLGDIERDGLHPTKRHRPIAAGLISPQLARTTAATAATTAVATGIALGSAAALAVLAYLALTMAYSRRLKHLPFIELGVVAAGFVLRVIAGAAATTTPLSIPFLVIVGGGSLLLATGKRYAELRELGDRAAAHRPVLAGYTMPILERILLGSAATAVLGYLGWALSTRLGGPGMVWLLASIVPFLVAARRGVTKVFAGAGADPTELILGDRALLAAGAATGILALAGLYLS